MVKYLHTNYCAQIILKKNSSVSSKSTTTYCLWLVYCLQMIGRWEMRVGRWEMHANLVTKPKGKKSVQRTKDGCNDNIKMDFKLI